MAQHRTHTAAEALSSLVKLSMNPTPGVHAFREMLMSQGRHSAPAQAWLACYFLLDPCEDQKGPSVSRFVNFELPGLIGHLSSDTARKREEFEGKIGGRVLWPATMKVRYAESNTAKYVCTTPRRDFDQLENQLLCFFMDRLRQLVRMVPDEMKSGWHLAEDAYSDNPHSNRKILQRIDGTLYRCQKSRFLRNISVPFNLTTEHLAACSLIQRKEYQDLMLLYQRYEKAMRVASWSDLLASAKRTFLIPGSLPEGDVQWLEACTAIWMTVSKN